MVIDISLVTTIFIIFQWVWRNITFVKIITKVIGVVEVALRKQYHGCFTLRCFKRLLRAG